LIDYLQMDIHSEEDGEGPAALSSPNTWTLSMTSHGSEPSLLFNEQP
jgi:hypothetical protein